MKKGFWLLPAISFLMPPALLSGGVLLQGNKAYREGKYEEAAKIYESEEEGSDLLGRRFNAGVSWLHAGSLDKAIERFEEVSSRAEGDLRRSSFFNAGYSYFQKGKTIGQDAQKVEDPEEKVKKLAEAAKAYHSAAQFFRSVEPSDGDTLENVAVTKTALRGVLDQMARIQEEKRKKAEEEALKSPAELLRALILKERQYRAMAKSFASDPRSKLRLEARQLRKAEAETRMLTQKLQHQLTAEPPSSPQQPGAQPGQGQAAPTGPSEEEKARNARAGEALGKAIKAQEDAEVAYSKLDMGSAASSHTRAIEELRSAREAFPLEIAALIEEALAAQEGIDSALEALLKPEPGSSSDPASSSSTGPQEAAKKSGIALGKVIVDALKDKVLQPLAKMMNPRTSSDAKAMADEEEEVVWGSQVLSHAEIAPQEAPPAASPSPAGQPPALSPEKAKELSEALRKEGETAHEASSKAKEELASGRAGPALPQGKKALEALKRAADLLPRPPEPPEVRLKKLIDKQEDARKTAEGLSSLSGDAQAAAVREVSSSQRNDGKEAGEIAAELEKRPDEPAKKAAPKVREGEAQVYSSAEALARDRLDEGKLAIERDIKALKEALLLLQGKEEKKDQEDKGQDQKDDQKDESKKKQDQKKPEKEQNSRYALTPREARLKQEEMDRERREQEAKLFAAPSGMTVEKDW